MLDSGVSILGCGNSILGNEGSTLGSENSTLGSKECIRQWTVRKAADTTWAVLRLQ